MARLVLQVKFRRGFCNHLAYVKPTCTIIQQHTGSPVANRHLSILLPSHSLFLPCSLFLLLLSTPLHVVPCLYIFFSLLCLLPALVYSPLSSTRSTSLFYSLLYSLLSPALFMFLAPSLLHGLVSALFTSLLPSLLALIASLFFMSQLSSLPRYLHVPSLFTSGHQFPFPFFCGPKVFSDSFSGSRLLFVALYT